MKIALINNFPPWTGIGKYASSLLDYINRSGHDAQLFSLNSFADQAGSKVVTVDKNNFGIFSTFKNYLVNPHRIPIDFDIYHVINEQIGVYSKYRRPSIVTFHDTFLRGPGSSFASGLSSSPKWLTTKVQWSKPYHYFINRNRLSAVHADAITCNSLFVKRNLIYNLPSYPPSKIHVICGLASNRVCPANRRDARMQLGLPENSSIVLCMGDKNNPVKNTQTAVTAFHNLSKLLKTNEPLLIVVGALSQKTERLISELSLDTNTLIFDRLQESEMALAYQSSDVLLFPVFYAGFGMPLIEAFASMCPVVSSNVGSIPEVAGNAALLYEPTDVGGFVNGLLNVLTDGNLRQSMMNKGFERAKSYRIEVWGKAMIDLYEAVINGV